MRGRSDVWDKLAELLVEAAVLRGGHSGLRTWFGPLDDISEGQKPYQIARHMGLSTREPTGPSDWTLRKLTRAEAVSILAYVMTDSLAYPSWQAAPTPLVERIEAAFDTLGPNAKFYSNGYWPVGNGQGWTPLTDATFDAGVIGVNEEMGFLVWVEEED